MKNKLFIIAIATAIGVGVASAAIGQTKETKKINLLYLNSYENGYQWSDTILEGIKSVINNSSMNIDMHIEYMDTKIRYNQEVKMHLYAIYALKYHNVDFDIIIVSDNNGFDFYLQFQNDLFPGVPTIFCGINDFSPQTIHGMSHVTGVVESFDIKENLELAQKFHPERKRFVVIEDNSTTAKAIKSQILQAFNKMAVTPKYEFLKAVSLDQLTHDAKAMAADTVFYLIPFYMDDHQGRYTAKELVNALWKSTRAPIYSNWKFMVGSGVVGGKMLDGFEHGAAAARMAISVLEGNEPIDLPVVKPNDELFIFDNNIMDVFNIDSDDLPSGSKIINRTAYFFEIDRKLFWFMVFGVILVTVTLVFLIFNISERRISEKELRKSRRMLQSVLDNIPQHVHWKDKNLKYIGANRSFGNFYGLKDLGAVVGKTDIDLIMDNNVARLSMQTDRNVVQQDKGAYHMRWTLQRSENDKVWLKVNRVPLHDHAGKVVGVLSTAEDITQNVKLQKKLIETTKMEAIGTLAGGIAHDFNNILTSIINSTELAIEDVPADTMAASDLRRSLKAARRGSRLVKQILTFSRADKERFRPTRIAEIVEEAVQLIEASLPGNIKIHTHISSETAICLADPTQIHQVVLNLCTNAFQALKDKGGTLSIQLKLTEVDADQAEALDIEQGLYVHLVISDNGPGICAQIQDKIFDPFFTTKGQGEGTGLGLAVVHGIVRGHNGAIRVSSIPYQDTDFEIFLPLVTVPSLSPAQKDPKINGGKETILFVEDDQDQLQLIPRVLTQLGYSVVACPNAMEACQHVDDENNKFDLIITDYDMPEMTGLQLAENVARTHPNVPVIVMTGRKAPEGMDRCICNIKKLILKPYNKESISIAIRQVLDRVEVPMGQNGRRCI